MPYEPSSGHGGLVYIELDPVADQGTFTEVPGLNYDMNLGAFTRAAENVTPHNNNQADVWVRAATIERDAFPMTLNHDPANEVHQALQSHAINNLTFGMRILGPSGVAATDEIIWSGGMTSWKPAGPVREGKRMVECEFRPSGNWKVNGVLYD